MAKPKSGSKPARKTKAKKPAHDQPPTEIDPLFAPVVEAFAKDRYVECGKGWGVGNTVLKAKGKIFAMTVGGNLVIKISKDRAAELVGDKTGTYFDPRKDGRLMKEWVVVKAGKANWIELAQEARRFQGKLRTS